MNYYNDNDPKIAAWLRELIGAGLIPKGDVDERSILEVKPHEISNYTQCHFFAGIAGWPLALKFANWPDDQPVWTGSCPCQPLSCAGQRKGHADKRHLWPAFYALIAECRPATIFGEQVAGTDGREWLAGVRTDLEGAGYAVGAADLCAAATGAPHIRQRLYWVANTENGARMRAERCGAFSGMGNANKPGSQGRCEHFGEHADKRTARETGEPCRMGDAGRECDEFGRGIGDVGCQTSQEQGEAQKRERRGDADPDSGANGAWSRFDIVHCRDGKSRRFEPGSFPLANGVSNRVGLLRGYGNAIVPQVAAEFIMAAMESF